MCIQMTEETFAHKVPGPFQSGPHVFGFLDRRLRNDVLARAKELPEKTMMWIMPQYEEHPTIPRMERTEQNGRFSKVALNASTASTVFMGVTS